MMLNDENQKENDDKELQYWKLKFECIECNNLISQFEIDTHDSLCLYCY